MQDNENQKQPLDDDILQCKADLREVLGALSGSGSNTPPIDRSENRQSPENSSGSTEEDNNKPNMAEIESELDDLLLPELSDDTFDESGNVASKPVTEAPLPKPANENPAISHDSPRTQEKLHQELHEKNQQLGRLKQRMQFLETQLQNAVAIERAKARIEQEVTDLNAKNRELTEELVSIKRRMENTDHNDTQIQQFQNELKAAKATLTRQQAMLQQAEETTQTLRTQLVLSKQQAQDSSAKQSQNEQQLTRYKSEHDRVRRELNQLREEKNADLSKAAGQLESLQKNYRELQHNTEHIQQDYEAFQTQAADQIRGLTETRDKLKNENSTLKDERNQLWYQHQQINQSLEQIQTDRDRLDHALSSERERIQNIRHQQQQQAEALSRAVREKEELAERLIMLESVENRLREDLEELRRSAVSDEAIRDQLAAAMRERDELAVRVQTLENSERRLNDELTQLRQTEASSQAVRRELTAARDEIDRLDEQNRALIIQLQDLRSAPESMDAVHESTESPIEFIEAEPDPVAQGIPTFNLADQIMEAQRRSAGGRRRRIESAPTAVQSRSVQDVVSQYIPSAVVEEPPAAEPPARHHLWIDPSLTPFQQDILQEIVRSDMKHCAANTSGNYSSIFN